MTHENIYNLTLDQQAETAQRMLNDVQLQKTGAIALQNGRLEVTSDHYQTAQAEMEDVLSVRPRTEAEVTRNDNSAETDSSIAEKLHGIVDRSGIAVSTYMTAEVIKGRTMCIDTLHSTTMTRQEAQRFGQVRTANLPLAELNTQGVAEIVTFTSLPDHNLLSKVPGREGRGDLTAVTYETTDLELRNVLNKLSYAEREKYQGKTKRYPTGFDRVARGASFSYNLFMGTEDAAALRNLITEQPETVHRLNETIMTQAFGADPEAFSRLGPQYDAWREADGGQMKLAIRDALDAPPEESRIIEY